MGRIEESPLYLTLGKEGYEKLMERQARLHICMKCKYFSHDGDSQDVCEPPNEASCLLVKKEARNDRAVKGTVEERYKFPGIGD